MLKGRYLLCFIYYTRKTLNLKLIFEGLIACTQDIKAYPDSHEKPRHHRVGHMITIKSPRQLRINTSHVVRHLGINPHRGGGNLEYTLTWSDIT